MLPVPPWQLFRKLYDVLSKSTGCNAAWVNEKVEGRWETPRINSIKNELIFKKRIVVKWWQKINLHQHMTEHFDSGFIFSSVHFPFYSHVFLWNANLSFSYFKTSSDSSLFARESPTPILFKVLLDLALPTCLASSLKVLPPVSNTMCVTYLLGNKLPKRCDLTIHIYHLTVLMG